MAGQHDLNHLAYVVRSQSANRPLWLGQVPELLASEEPAPKCLVELVVRVVTEACARGWVRIVWVDEQGNERPADLDRLEELLAREQLDPASDGQWPRVVAAEHAEARGPERHLQRLDLNSALDVLLDALLDDYEQLQFVGRLVDEPGLPFEDYVRRVTEVVHRGVAEGWVAVGQLEPETGDLDPWPRQDPDELAAEVRRRLERLGRPPGIHPREDVGVWLSTTLSGEERAQRLRTEHRTLGQRG